MAEDTTSDPTNQTPESRKPITHPANAISEGATNKSVLILAASISLALDRLPIERNLKQGFLDQLEILLVNGLREYNASQAEIDWLTEIHKDLRSQLQ